MFGVEFYSQWFIIRQIKYVWKPSEPRVRQMLTICREIRTSIQGSVMELNQIFELIFPLLMASDNISVSFLPSVDLLIQDVRPVCAWSDIESWFWLMRSNTNTSGRCSHLDGLSVSRRQIWIDAISSTCKDTGRGHLFFFISYLIYLYGSVDFPWWKIQKAS